MTQVMAPPCERCGQTLNPQSLVCHQCGALAHRAELEALSREAMAMEPHDLVGAMQRWQRCLQLLPPDSQQYAAIYVRLSQLAARLHSSAGGVQQAPPVEDTAGSAVLKTGGSMLISILIYAVVFASAGGPPLFALLFATGFVVLILVHELGHVAAMRYYGLSASPPIFIPFLGAVINLRQVPQNAKVEAVVGIGGPIAGTFGALACYAMYLALPESPTKDLTHALSYFGFLLNLFNLLPVPPLDGGRITAAVSPKVWMLGIAGLIAMAANDFYHGRYPILLLVVLFFALPRIKATLARRNANDPYYAISRGAKWTIGGLYVALGVLLVVMQWLTEGALNRL
jgi:Zn-dependent protease